MATFTATLRDSGVFSQTFSSDSVFEASFEQQGIFAELFSIDSSFDASMQDSGSFGANFGTFIRGGDADIYTGSYEFTPADNPQTILISNKTATSNIVINEIPSNYGKISYDGSALMVE